MTEQVYGADMVPQKIDRQVEDAQIRNQPPAAVGNPRGGSVLTQLQSLFKGYDDEHTTVLSARAKSGAQFWFEFDVDVTEEDLLEYGKAGQSRANRRNNQAAPASKAKVMARTLSDRNTKVYTTDPADQGLPLRDAEDDLLTVHSDEWLQALGVDDPVAGLRALFGDVKLTILYNEFMDAVGHIGDPEAVDPTRDSSGD